MKLYEFFGNIKHDVNQDKDLDPHSPTKEDEQELCDNVFWYILDQDDLHKKYFMPAARELKARYLNTKDNSDHDWKEWLPMINAGCMSFYKDHDIKEDPKDVFNKGFRRDLCKRLEDHYREAILDDKDEK